MHKVFVLTHVQCLVANTFFFSGEEGGVEDQKIEESEIFSGPRWFPVFLSVCSMLSLGFLLVFQMDALQNSSL